MKKFTSTLIALSLVFQSINALAQSEDKDGFPLQDVINEVQIALQEVQNNLESKRLPKLKSIDLSFETVVSTTGGAKVKFLIFSFGKKIQKEKAQVISFQLTPPNAGQEIEVANRKGISDQLVETIYNSASAMDAVKLNETGPQLEFSQLVVELKFVVKKSTSGGVEFEISPVTIGLEGDLSKTAVHKIKVTFE